VNVNIIMMTSSYYSSLLSQWNSFIITSIYTNDPNLFITKKMIHMLF